MRYDPIVRHPTHLSRTCTNSNQVKEARLENKNRVVIIQTCEDIINQAEEAVANHKAHIRDLQDKGDPISSSLRQKAILFTYLTVSAINAETVISRYYELKAVVEHFKRIPDLDKYEIPVDNLKPTTNWTVEWGARDDAHLLIGIWKHGFGSWEAISHVRYRALLINLLFADLIRMTLSDLKTRSSSTTLSPNLKGLPRSVFPVRSTLSDEVTTSAVSSENTKRIDALSRNRMP
jgi:chromodomain-helicase-DNA-binding protein 1